MHVLLINAFNPDDPSRHLVQAARQALHGHGHEISEIDLVPERFAVAMSPAERAVYHDDENLVSPETRRSADLVRQVDALLFCYPTVTHMLPAVLKGWCDRVLVPGVAIVFDEKGKVRPGMTNVKRLGAITTTPHGRRARWRHRDLGRRIALQTMRLNCASRCRRSFVRVDATTTAEDAASRVRKTFSGW